MVVIEQAALKPELQVFDQTHLKHPNVFIDLKYPVTLSLQRPH